MNLSPEDIRNRLHSQQQTPNALRGTPPSGLIPDAELTLAAVLLPLFQDDQKWYLIFIKRTELDHDDHSGQIAFPGGRMEKGDPSLTATALRESEEEIGLRPQDVDILGFSHDITTVTRYRITPIVGLIPWPYPLRPSPLEVERILSIPLHWLIDPENHRIQPWRPKGEEMDPYPIIFFNAYQGETLWGATAKIVLDLLDLLSP
jgi:8-oxo-dGTP pyrophosphatase MutT (NUDIX family)